MGLILSTFKSVIGQQTVHRGEFRGMARWALGDVGPNSVGVGWGRSAQEAPGFSEKNSGVRRFSAREGNSGVRRFSARESELAGLSLGRDTAAAGGAAAHTGRRLRVSPLHQPHRSPAVPRSSRSLAAPWSSSPMGSVSRPRRPGSYRVRPVSAGRGGRSLSAHHQCR